jgi:type II secretory pathway pseudopilin PulG
MNARDLHFQKRTGFTLIEVIVTLSIFILLTASVFGIMTAVFQSSNALKDNQNRRDEVSALHDFLKNRFENLAAADHLLTYRRGDGDGLGVNGILLLTQGETEAVDASPQPNGLYSLRLGQPPPPTSDQEPAPTVMSFLQELEKNVDALTWTPLIRDVKSITWKFQTPPSDDWMPEWTNDSSKPGLIECSVQLAGDDKPTVMDFPIPHLAASPSQAPVEVASHGP